MGVLVAEVLLVDGLIVTGVLRWRDAFVIGRCDSIVSGRCNAKLFGWRGALDAVDGTPA